VYPLDAPSGGGFRNVPAARPLEADVRLWVRADRAALDAPLAAAVLAWLDATWPFVAVHAPGRRS
jgi:hypothetical protein